MMVSVETLPGLERRIEVSVPATRVRQQVDARLLKVSRTVRIKGFRPGKAPIHVVRKHYGREVRDEVVSDLIRETFAEALRQEKLQPAGGPRIEPQKTGEPDDLRYTATFEVFPQVELKDLGAHPVDAADCLRRRSRYRRDDREPAPATPGLEGSRARLQGRRPHHDRFRGPHRR